MFYTRCYVALFIMKISKCCESKVKIFKGDIGWNVICVNCNKECDFIEIPNKCKRCENYGNSKGCFVISAELLKLIAEIKQSNGLI